MSVKAQAQAWGIPLSLASGLLLGFVHLPLPWAWLLPLPLALVFYLIAREENAKWAARSAFFGGLGFFSVHLFWLPQSFGTLYPNFAWVFWLAMPLIWIGKAGFWALMAFIAKTLAQRTLPTLVALACGLVIVEWLCAFGPLGFPWGNVGYAMIDTPLAQIAALGGVHLLSLLVALLAAGLAGLAFLEWRLLAAMLGITVAGFGYGIWQINQALPLADAKALLVQGNIDPLKRARGELSTEREIDVYRKLSQTDPQTLIVWPEGAVSVAEAQTVAGRLAVGTAKYEANTFTGIENGKLLGRSIKARPVPFGETFIFARELPFIYRPLFAAMFNDPDFAERANSYLAGLDQRVIAVGPDQIGGYICYDSVFPEVARFFAVNDANVFANVSNDGWFGETWGLWQHFNMGRMRAIENKRYVLRAGHTGITALVSPYGQVLQQLTPRTRDTLLVNYARISEKTIYTQLGDWAVALALVLGLAAVARGRQSRKWLR
jgi:apolipoprotein N-acyltransferase